MFELDLTAVLGFAAAILSTFAGVPQMVKAWRTRSTGDLSLIFLLMAFSGCLLWLVYGFLLDSLPMVSANLVGLAVLGTTIRFKLKYGMGSRPEDLSGADAIGEDA
jgi:MtN3 and saliva related transmembrane protein